MMRRYLAIGWLVFLGLVVCVGLGAAIYEGWPDSGVAIALIIGVIISGTLTSASIEYLSRNKGEGD